MTRTIATFTSEVDSSVAGHDLGKQIRAGLADSVPDAVIVFASSRYDYEALLKSLEETCRPAILVGASSAGEFTSNQRGEGSACALAIRSADIKFASGFATGVATDRAEAARRVVSGFRGLQAGEHRYRAALVMTDALAGHADDLIEQLTITTRGGYEFAGGGAGDDGRFAKTHVFHGHQVATNAVVALEMVSSKPLGIGVQHGWVPAGDALRVTAVDRNRLIGLDGFPAVEAFEEHARRTEQELDRAAPLSFFLHNILGIETPAGHRLRVPLAIEADGSVTCAAEVPEGARVRIMQTSTQSAAEAAATATRSAVAKLRGKPPAAAVFFDCVATRLRLGSMFGFELEAVRAALGHTQLVGCNTYGQIARADGQFGGFHNCTAVVLALPE